MRVLINSLWIAVPAFLLLQACGGDADSDPPGSAAAGPLQLTEIQWLDSMQRYGKIREGQQLTVTFRFRNAGQNPLIIRNVAPSCGCTVAEFPREPIASGKEGEISGRFDSQGRVGHQHKDLTVTANTEPRAHILRFEVEVIPSGDTP